MSNPKYLRYVPTLFNQCLFVYSFFKKLKFI